MTSAAMAPLNGARCPHCGRAWHRSALGDPLPCPGSTFIGPRAPSPIERAWAILASAFGSIYPWQQRLLDIAVGDRIGYDSGDGIVHVSLATADDVAAIRRAAAEQFPPFSYARRNGREAMQRALREFAGAIDDAPYVWGGVHSDSSGSVASRAAEHVDNRPPVPRPSTQPPMWANTPQRQRRNRRVR